MYEMFIAWSAGFIASIRYYKKIKNNFMSEDNPLEFVATCTIIEGWIWSAGTFEQLSLLADVIRVFVSSERFPEERSQILEGARSLLDDKLIYQKEKIAQYYENRPSSL